MVRVEQPHLDKVLGGLQIRVREAHALRNGELVAQFGGVW